MNSVRALLCSLAVLLLTFSVSAFSEEAAGDWLGQLDGGFKVRIHISKANSGYTGYLRNSSGNQTDLDQVTSDGSHLHFAATKLNLTYDGVWNVQASAWTGSLAFQQVYPLSLRRATAAELAPAIPRRPQEEAIAAGPLPYEQTTVQFENISAHNRLAGTLSMPRGSGPFPAIVLVSGTGHNTR